MSDKTVVGKATPEAVAEKYSVLLEPSPDNPHDIPQRFLWLTHAIAAIKEYDEESAATIRSLLYAFEHANNRDHPYTDWCDGCNPKAALAQARRSK